LGLGNYEFYEIVINLDGRKEINKNKINILKLR
jgi:hypothetical protein